MPKYNPFPPIGLKDRTWPDKVLDKAPSWCSVDLRDGNQALVNPMSVDQKLDMFDLLCKLGFKEIEVGFPSASQTEFDFLRRLVDENRIPKDVTIQVLCQARQHLVDRTFESLKGVKKAIFHLYSSTSPAHRKYTFQMSRAEVLELAIAGVEMVKAGLSQVPETQVTLQYSPESFSQTELDFALEVSSAVHLTWGTEKTIILNLPATVECSTPNVHADQIEWFSRKIPHRDKVLISLHTHNDRGTGIAAAEMGILAGADRVEGTLFGNGERTGNLDIITLALNFFTQGVSTGLDFHNLPFLVSKYEELTGMTVHPRHPYAGDLVFTAFSGSHQDAIKKALDYRAKQNDPNFPWDVPYLPVDPKDLGRDYEAVIRFNSQSGKGGAAYLLKEKYGLDLPKPFHPEVGTLMNQVADAKGKELSAAEIWDIFETAYLKTNEPLNFLHFDGEIVETPSEKTVLEAHLTIRGIKKHLKAAGSGPLEAFANALRSEGFPDFEILDFHENSVTQGAGSRAAAFVQIKMGSGTIHWGCGLQESITQAGLAALVSALNRAYSPKK